MHYPIVVPAAAWVVPSTVSSATAQHSTTVSIGMPWQV